MSYVADMSSDVMSKIDFSRVSVRKQYLTLYVFTLNQSDSERKYAATIYKNCIYLTRFLSEIDRLVYFQFQIQHESSIKDLNSGCSPV